MSNYQNEPIRFGLQGLVLKRARDLVDPNQATILSNLDHVNGGKLIVRAGQTAIGNAGTRVHTIRRLNPPSGISGAVRLYGIDTGIYRDLGLGGGPVSWDTGYSGNVLAMVPYRSEIAGDSWMYIGDSNKMSKIRVDGTIMPIGLPAPGVAATAVLAAIQSTSIDPMNATTGWAAHHGGEAGVGNPSVTTSAPAPPGLGGTATTLETAAGTTKVPYIQWMDKALTVDLTQVGSLGANSASDSDYIHLSLYMDFPSSIVEIRVYFVTSAFTAGVIPGTSVTQNLAGYWKAFGASDFAAALAGSQSASSALNAAERAALNASLGVGIKTPPPGSPVVGTAVPRGTTPLSVTSPAGSGDATWTEFGTVGKPLYRSDFTGFGTAPNWATVTGVVVWVSVAGNPVSGAVSPNVKVAVNDSRLFGGYGLDDGAVGTRNYDWLYTNYDPRTGAESNGSPVMTGQATSPMGTWLDVLRGSVTLTPAAYGNAALRQRFYRRGGTLTDNWYFTGVNTADGGMFLDTHTDSFVQGTGLTTPIDHFQPIASIDASGNTILNQPVPALWGPLQGMLFACGDPNRGGWVYSSKPNEPDHWINAIEVTAELLQNGCIFADRCWAFSTERLYQIIPNLDTGGGLTSLPTSCQHGMVSRWGLAVGLHGIYFCSRDGIFVTNGADEGLPISDDIRPLFDNQTVNGQSPIDFNHPERIKLRMVGVTLYFLFQDQNGFQACYLYSLLYQNWRRYDYTGPITEIYLEEGVPQSVLLGEATGGFIDTAFGLTDRGSQILWHYRSGAMDQGSPRAEKRYGDLAIDVDVGGAAALNVQAYSDDEATFYPPIFYPVVLAGRQRLVIPLFGGGSAATVRARNLSIDLSGGSITGSAVLYLMEIAAASEPADYQLWETDEINHGIPGWQTPLYAYIAIRSVNGLATITLVRQVYDDLQNLLYPQDIYTFHVGVVKSHIYLPFNAMKGALFSYRMYTNNQYFRIYPDETSMLIQPQSGPPVTVHPFATTDAAIQGVNPLLAALRPGGAL